MESDVERLKHRAQELREALSLLRDRAACQRIDPRERERLGAKLAHVERKLFLLRQMRLFKGV